MKKFFDPKNMKSKSLLVEKSKVSSKDIDLDK